MKHQKLKTFSLVLVAAIVIIGCNPLKKMIKNAETVNYELTPNPLEMHADSVEISLSGKIPSKYFHKKALVTVTPMLKSVNGDATKEFEPIVLVGEAADGDGTIIKQADGGSFSYNDKIPYNKDYNRSELMLKIVGSYKGKDKEFPSVKAGDGIITTPLMVQSDEKPILGEDKFTKVVPRSYEAGIHYLINSSYVRPAELRDDDIEGLKEFTEKGVEKEFVFKSVNILAYASPDGEISLNENLADDRAKSAKKAISKIMERAGVEKAGEDSFFNLTGKGEDWDGFKEKMEASDIEDKKLILRVLEMYTDLNKREQEIKNLAATYVEVAEKILPELRRSQIEIKAEEKSKTDEQIQELAATAPDSLTAEELLYAATLTNDMDKKLKIYQSFSKIHTDDWRGPNNVGYVYLTQNKLNEASAEFEKAQKLDKDNDIIKNNLGIVARWKGDLNKAKELYNEALSARKAENVKYNLGIINIMEGDYTSATANFGSSTTFNAALAKLLNVNPEGALKTLESSEAKTTAEGYYLKAIAGARTSDKDLVINNLKTAISKDPSMKAKAKNDVEFINYFEDPDFQAITQ